VTAAGPQLLRGGPRIDDDLLGELVGRFAKLAGDRPLEPVERLADPAGRGDDGVRYRGRAQAERRLDLVVHARQLDHRRAEQVRDAVLDAVDDGGELAGLGIELDGRLRQHADLIVEALREGDRLALQGRRHLVDAAGLHRDLLAELGGAAGQVAERACENVGGLRHIGAEPRQQAAILVEHRLQMCGGLLQVVHQRHRVIAELIAEILHGHALIAERADQRLHPLAVAAEGALDIGQRMADQLLRLQRPAGLLLQRQQRPLRLLALRQAPARRRRRPLLAQHPGAGADEVLGDQLHLPRPIDHMGRRPDQQHRHQHADEHAGKLEEAERRAAGGDDARPPGRCTVGEIECGKEDPRQRHREGDPERGQPGPPPRPRQPRRLAIILIGRSAGEQREAFPQMALLVGGLDRDGGMLTLADSRHAYTPPLDPTNRQSPRRALQRHQTLLRPRSPTVGLSSTVLPFPGQALAGCAPIAWGRITEKMGQTPHRPMLHHRRVAKQRHFHPPWMQIQWVTLLRLATRLKSEQTFIHHREHPEDGLPGVSRRKFDLARCYSTRSSAPRATWRTISAP
jgi:hypothetical protein